MNPEMAIVPPGGGWKFYQKLPNGANHVFVEPSEEKLYETILRFRRNNNLPTETIRQEMKIGVSSPVVPIRQEGRSIRERVTHWLLDRQFGTVRYVTPEVAEARAKEAVSCPNNVTNYADECIECYNNTIRGLYAIRQGRTTPYDDKLGACSLCGWDNKTAVHLASSCLKSKSGLAKGVDCWCGKLDNDPDREVG